MTKRTMTMAGKLMAESARAKRAYGEHCDAAGWRQCDVCSEMKVCRELFAYGLETIVCEDCERGDR